MQAILKALSWTFVHSLWQGLLAALIAAIIISLTRKAAASLRYNLLGLLLLVFFAVTIITFTIELRIVSAALAADDTAGIITNSLKVRPAAILVPSSFTGNWSEWFDNNSALFMMLWAFFFLFQCIKLVKGVFSVQRLRSYKVHPVTDEWMAKLQQLKNDLHIKQSVQLLQSELVKVPVALGFLKPVILLPVGLITHLPVEQVETILLHELGHIRRKDYLINLFLHVGEAIFFFNPAVRWISSLLREEREACCDDIVMHHTNVKSNYLNALVAFQEYSGSQASFAMAISHRKNYLLNRVKRMLTNENHTLNIGEKLCLLSGILIFSAFTFIREYKTETVSLALPAEVSVVEFKLPSPAVIEESKKNTPELKVNKNKRKTTVLSISPANDTIPVKKENKAPAKTEWEKAAANTLQEIKVIKDRIQVKKDSIGVKKEKLKNYSSSDEEKKVALLKALEKERKETDEIREELEKKRAQLAEYNKNINTEKKKDTKSGLFHHKDEKANLFLVQKKIFNADTRAIKVEKKDFQSVLNKKIFTEPEKPKVITKPTAPENKTSPPPGKKTPPQIKQQQYI